MKNFAKMAVAAAIAGMAMTAQAAAIVIDDFSTDQLEVIDSTASFAPLSGVSGTVAGGGILGGNRDLYVQKVAGASTTRKISMGVDSGELFYNTDSNASGFGIIRWDGAHFDGFLTIDRMGLGGVDFTAGGIGFFVQVTSADLGFPFTLNVYSNTVADNSTSLTLFSGGPGGYFISFADLLTFGTPTGTGADFTNVGALEAIVNTGGGAGTIDLTIQLVQSVPEPGTMALAGLALLGLGAIRRRKQA